MKLLYAYRGLAKTYGEVHRYYLYEGKSWVYNPKFYLKEGVIKADRVLEHFEIETTKRVRLDKR